MANINKNIVSVQINECIA